MYVDLITVTMIFESRKEDCVDRKWQEANSHFQVIFGETWTLSINIWMQLFKETIWSIQRRLVLSYGLHFQSKLFSCLFNLLPQVRNIRDSGHNNDFAEHDRTALTIRTLFIRSPLQFQAVLLHHRFALFFTLANI